MKVSVVVCTYSTDRYQVFKSCVESILNQTYEPIELVIVVDGNETLEDRIESDFGDRDVVRIHGNSENRGISFSRTRGAELATGDIVAMIDDDATAAPDWIERLVDVYRQTDAVAVGGYVASDWVTDKPDFFPEEFYWLVGCTEKGFAEDGEEVRNTYGSNISYKRDVLLSVGGYDVKTGRKGDRHIQAHEAPVGIRIREKYGKGMIYAADAVVHHKLFDYRGEFRWLVYRSFWQGFSKRVMNALYPENYGSEGRFLRTLFTNYVPARMKKAVTGPSLAQLKQIAAILVFTGAVGCGYLYGLTKRNILDEG